MGYAIISTDLLKISVKKNHLYKVLIIKFLSIFMVIFKPRYRFL